MTECSINGIPVKFPFEPYDLQKDYMSKVIECLQNDSHGVLESPTGTGKTLSLLCSSLAWLELKKAQLQAQWHVSAFGGHPDEKGKYVENLNSDLKDLSGNNTNNRSSFMAMPQIIYSSRTHTQLSQAMNELKRTAYSYMKASVLGSREQMCIHPEVMKEENSSVKINMCRIKVKSRSCHFYNRVERMKDNPLILEQKVVDIEDLVKLAETHKFCPYFMSKEMKQKADIIFMPYNYLLDPRARRALGVELSNNVIILDEAHNIERICEDSASLQLKTTDITLCIEEVTEVMKAVSDDNLDILSFQDSPPDFTAEELCALKQIFLDFERVLDGIEIKNESEGVHFEGNHIFKLLADAGITDSNYNIVMNLIEKISGFLATATEGPFQRRGKGLQLFEDMLRIAFASTHPQFKEKIQKCYKVHVMLEEPTNQKKSNWLSKATAKAGCRILSYWCFSPGFGMNMLMDQGVKCVILTSGTLAPLNPLITELELKVGVQLENPHIVQGNQVCVKILGKGPDGSVLNSNFRNRNNPAYIKSLGMTINNLSRMIPAGLLIFFPSYPIMKKCRDSWQEDGLWSSICQQKAIFVEPKEKIAFQEAMINYYKNVNDPNLRGAIFMGVCRGKVSEGLDFADTNGRAVIITGLPYPPLKDPRIILKKRYLDTCRARNKEYLSGDDWYSLEATKAVNQAIGRVIRHKNDYGAIILLDERFNSQKILGQMSLWLRKHVKSLNNYGEIIRELKMFFTGAQELFPTGLIKPQKNNGSQAVPATFDIPTSYKKPALFDFSSSSSCSSLNSSTQSNGLVTIHKRSGDDNFRAPKRPKRIELKRIIPLASEPKSFSQTEVKEYLAMVQKSLSSDESKTFFASLRCYKDNSDFKEFCKTLDAIFLPKPNLRHIVAGLDRFIKREHSEMFNTYWSNIR